MLLALLPFTGHAADFTTEANVTVDDIYFGLNLKKNGTVKYVTVKVNTNELTEGTDYNLETSGTGASAKVNYYTTAECTTKASLVSGSLTPVPGTYWVKIVPANNDNSNWAAGKVIVKKMPLKVAVANASKTFNNKSIEDPAEASGTYALGTVTSITLMEKSDWATTALSSGDQFNALKAKMTVGRNAGKDVKYNGATVDGYAYTITLSNDVKDCYTIEAANISGKYTINPAPFPTTMGTTGNTFAVTVKENEKVYNGSAQTAKVTLVDNNIGYTLTVKDYIVYYGGGTAVDQTDYDGGNGYQISFNTRGNYAAAASAVNLAITDDAATTDVDESKLNKLWIKKAPLGIYVDDLTKTYDGTETITGATFGFTGLVGADMTKEKPFGDNFEAVYVSGTTGSHIYEGTYGVKAQAISSPNFTGTTYSNYDPSFLEFGQLKVEKRKVTITVANKEKYFSAADNPTEWAYTVEAATTNGKTGALSTALAPATPGTPVADKTWLERAYTVVRNNADVEAVGTYSEALVLQEKEDATMKTAYNLTDAQLEEVKKVLDQYTIDEKKGTFKIKTASLTVTPRKKTITYGEDYNLADFEVIATNESNARVTLTKTPSVKFKNAAYNTENPKNAGVYVMVVEGEIAADGYDGANAVRNEGQFIINKKHAEVILEDQHLMVGDFEDALLANKVRFVEDATATEPVDALIDGDVIGFRLAFNEGSNSGEIADADVVTLTDAATANTGVTGYVDCSTWTIGTAFTAAQVTAYNTAITGGNVTTSTIIAPAHIYAIVKHNNALTGATKPGLQTSAATTGSYAKGVTIYPVASTTVNPNQNGNYDIAWTTGTPAVNAYFGKLYVVTNTGLALNSDDNDLANVQKLGAANTPITSAIKLDLNPRNAQKLPSTTARIWDAKQWNTLVLPFDIEVADLSQAFGYAIVNVVNPEKTTTNNVAFKLYMDKIPANTPFLIKTAKKLVDATTPALGFTTNGVVTFPAASRTIKAPTEAQMEGVDAGMGYKFVPVYQTKTVDNTQSVLRFLLGNYEKWAFIEKEGSSWTLVPLTAYVDLTPAGNAAHEVTFTMEEADGSTTTVRSIEADGIDNSVSEYAKGWYTINGMKLDAAPAQKGVYILNGKKVVVK